MATGRRRMSRGARLVIGLSLAALLLWIGWHAVVRLGIGRVYVGPDQMMVLVAKFGGELEPGQILARAGQKGIQAEAFGPGRYFVNPFTHDHELHPMVRVPAGGEMQVGADGALDFGAPPQVGVVTAMIGDELPEGEYLAGEGQKGLRRRVLGPGRYLLNPYAFRVELHPAVSVPPGSVGVVTHLSGENTQSELAQPDQRGVQAEVLPPGLYFLNPYEYQVVPVKVGYDDLTFEQDSAITFAATDSNTIKVDATIVWGLTPADAPHIIKQFGSAALVKDRLIRPQCESVMRLAGSNYRARDFIEGDTRRRFQETVETNLKAALEAKHVRVLLALIRRIEVPDSVRKPIQDAKIAEEQTLYYEVLTETSKVQQRLKEVKGEVMKEEARARSETDKLVLEGFARGNAEVVGVEAMTELEVQGILAEAARERFEAQRILGLAQSEAQRLQGEALAEGLRRRVEAFGDVEAYELYRFAENLSGELEIQLRYAGEGTLWTDVGELIGKWKP